MRFATVLGAVAIIAAIAASAALYVVPRPEQPVPTPSTTASPTPGEIVTYGKVGEVSPEKARSLLSSNVGRAVSILPPVKVLASFGGEASATYTYTATAIPAAAEGMEYSSTNVQVPGIDEGDVLKLAPPYGLYITRGTLYLLLLWPPGNMSIIDSAPLSNVVNDAVSAGLINVSGDSYGVSVGEAQALVVGDTAVVSFTYQVFTGGPTYWCSSNETINVSVGGQDFAFIVPVCYPSPGTWGTIIATYKFGGEGLELTSYHALAGLRLVDTRLSNGTVYAFTVPYAWLPTGDEAIDGVSVLEAGPTYVVGDAGKVRTLVTVIALSPATGEVGVTNVILPAWAFTSSLTVYMKGQTAYLLMRDAAPSITGEEIAKAVRACAPKAPEDLRKVLEALGPSPSPEDVLKAIKEWGRGFEDYLAPLLAWIHDETGGVIEVPGSIDWDEVVTLPENLSDALDRLWEEADAISNFSDCVSDALGNVSASSTTVVRLDFSGLAGSVTASARVPGTVYDRFGVHEDGQYLYVVTTEEVGRAYFMPAPAPRIMAGFPYWGEGPEIPMWLLVNEVFIGAQGLEYLENATDLTDLITVTPLWGWSNGSSLYVLNATDLTPASSLTGIAPGERVYAARYVGNYLYLVTYRQVDPLFGIDISDPAKPRVLGWLEIPGYSEYLHPWGSKYLVGVGVGESWGLKVDLYDVSDPANITRVSSAEVGGWSQALWDHHAFQPIDNETFAIPVTLSESGEGIAVFQVVPGEGLKYLGLVSVESPVRAARIDGVLYAFGYSSVVAASLPGLDVVASLQLFGGEEPPYVTTVTVVETATQG